jgi:hypothetical protein
MPICRVLDPKEHLDSFTFVTPKGVGWKPNWFDKDGNHHIGTAQPADILAHGGPLATASPAPPPPVRLNFAPGQHVFSSSMQLLPTLNLAVKKDRTYHSGTAQPPNILATVVLLLLRVRLSICPAGITLLHNNTRHHHRSRNRRYPSQR